MIGAGPSNPVVLVVEDSQDLLGLYELILSEVGYTVVAAPEGRAGLDLARTLRPAVIVLDMVLPDMDGLEFLERLARDVENQPPVVAISGFVEFEPNALARGARAFFRKPLSLDELVAAVERARAGHPEPTPTQARSERLAAAREQARDARERLWARIDLEDAELIAMLEGVVAWLSRYAGFGTGLIDLLCADKLRLQAGATARLSIDPDLAFCSNVIDAGSSLVISETAGHAVFEGHKACAHWGTRFYAGYPITMSSGLVVGTLCLIDRQSRRIRLGDTRVFEYLARRTAEHLGAMSEGRRPALFFEPPSLFERAAVEVVLTAQILNGEDVDLALVRFARAGAEPALFGRAAEVAQGSRAPRFAAARWTPQTLALVCGGARRSDGATRVLAALRDAELTPDAIGVARCRLGDDRRATVGEVIGAAEAACARSADAGGAAVDDLVPPRRAA